MSESTLEVLQEAQPKHEFRVFGGTPEVGSVTVLDKVVDEGKVYNSIDLPE